MPSDPENRLLAEAGATLRRPEAVDCLEQLDRLVQRGALAPEARSHALLSYLIEHYLRSGPGVPIKAYAIAVDVLGRGKGFDPAQDSIVRVEIGRLRKLLEMYFLGPGRQDPVRFALPKGQTHLEVAFAGDPAPAPVALAAPPALRGNLSRVALVAVAVVLVAVVLLLRPWADRNIEAALNEDFPRVFVRPFAKDPSVDAAFPGNGVSSFVASELSAFRSFRVIDPVPASTLPIRPQDYLLTGSFAAVSADDVMLDLRLRDGLGTVLWTRQLGFGAQDLGAPEPVFAALSDIAATLGGSLGVIDSAGRARLGEERQEWARGTPSDFRCFLRWQSFDLTKDPEEGEAARNCLEQRAEADTPVGQIWSAVAFLRYLDWTRAGAPAGDARLDAALAAASRAVLIDPNGPDGHEALGSILTGLGRLDEAEEALEKGLEINPSNLEMVIKLGWLDCLRGDWPEGTARIQAVTDRHSVTPGWYRLPLALAAWRDGDAAEVQRQAEAMLLAGDRRGLILALAAARMAGDATAEMARREQLAKAGLDPARALAEIQALFPDLGLISAIAATL